MCLGLVKETLRWLRMSEEVRENARAKRCNRTVRDRCSGKSGAPRYDWLTFHQPSQSTSLSETTATAKHNPLRGASTMALPPARSARRSTGRKASTPPNSRRSSGRFSRSGSSVSSARPPIVLEWSSWTLRVGQALQSRPQHVLVLGDDEEDIQKIRSREEWYYIVSPLISELYDRLMVEPSSRRVVLVRPPLLPDSLELALQQVLWDIGVPAVTLQSTLETVPYAMGWKRGMVLYVGKLEAFCQVHVDGHALRHTLQVVPCGYKRVVPTMKGAKPTIEAEWTEAMDHHWLDERQPNSLTMALLKCLEGCPRESRRDVIANLVFLGETPLLVPDLARRVGRRLIALLERNAKPVEDEAGVMQSALTVVPVPWSTLTPLSNHVAVTSTAPYRPDIVSWIGASLWAAAWHRHDDNDEHVHWTHPTQSGADA